MKPDRYKLYLNKQIKAIEKYKWNRGIELKCDPGEACIQEWIGKYAKKFRKDFAINDLKSAIKDIKVIRKTINSYMRKIIKMTKFIDDCEERLLEGIELLQNGNQV